MTLRRTYVLYCDGDPCSPDGECCASVLELGDRFQLLGWMMREGWMARPGDDGSTLHFCPRCQKLTAQHLANK